MYGFGRDHNRYEYNARGVDPQGLEAMLERYVEGSDWKQVTKGSLAKVLRVAARRMRATGLPAVLFVGGGKHAWTMNGYTATGDPAAADSFRVTHSGSAVRSARGRRRCTGGSTSRRTRGRPSSACSRRTSRTTSRRRSGTTARPPGTAATWRSSRCRSTTRIRRRRPPPRRPRAPPRSHARGDAGAHPCADRPSTAGAHARAGSAPRSGNRNRKRACHRRRRWRVSG